KAESFSEYFNFYIIPASGFPSKDHEKGRPLAVSIPPVEPRQGAVEILDVGGGKIVLVAADLAAPDLEGFGIAAIAGRENAAVEFSRRLHRLHIVKAGKLEAALERRLVDAARR